VPRATLGASAPAPGSRYTEIVLRFALALASAFALNAQSPCPPIPVFGRCEIRFELNAQEMREHPNPYLTVQLNVEFRSPKFRTFLMPAFWDGGNLLVVRFAPIDDGEWTYKVVSNIGRWNDGTGKFLAGMAPDAPGFIRPRNVHHWAYADSDRPHLWMGDDIGGFAGTDRESFTRLVDARAAQKFTHMRGSIMGPADTRKPAFSGPEQPDPGHFRAIDDRVAYLNNKGLVADLVLGSDRNQLAALFPSWQQRERYIRYVVARYSAFNVTWDLVRDFETYDAARDVMKELGLALKKADPYGHPRSTVPVTTSAPLAQDNWMDHVLYQSADDQLGAIEHQLYPVPFVNANFGCEGGAVSADQFRHHLWNAAMNGQSPTHCQSPATKETDSTGVKAMTAWYKLFSETRYWELEPYFDLDGARAVALPGVEYIVYVEQPSGPIEIRVEKHGYEARWVNPATGEEIPRDNIKAEKIVVEPPDRAHDWVLQISREGRKEGLMKSYKFESQAVPLQEVEVDARKVPFEISQPSVEEFSVAVPPRYEAKLVRQTRGTRSMMYLWTAEASIDSQGFRVLGTGGEGTLRIPRNLAGRYPATVNVRLFGMNANGKVYSLDRVYGLTQ
jgi:hypothetical protein